ncbi:WD40 repeat-like protein [Gonapodya prolifera JEL478]|uniref:WD40 repeat-like protein n=1 Tax=Gonapodya prolifera (strain JEL478) TaxID=1344416 RepID=A0A139ABM9_GONPJ|nr:WD40 repeat-like protein [Gonapodya prolifera JEL478]|eukprot:KXS13823.1 WD40 repeat-like protein [Gonapodya prolifera JEL478]
MYRPPDRLYDNRHRHTNSDSRGHPSPSNGGPWERDRARQSSQPTFNHRDDAGRRSPLPPLFGGYQNGDGDARKRTWKSTLYPRAEEGGNDSKRQKVDNGDEGGSEPSATKQTEDGADSRRGNDGEDGRTQPGSASNRVKLGPAYSGAKQATDLSGSGSVSVKENIQDTRARVSSPFPSSHTNGTSLNRPSWQGPKGHTPGRAPHETPSPANGQPRGPPLSRPLLPPETPRPQNSPAHISLPPKPANHGQETQRPGTASQRTPAPPSVTSPPQRPTNDDVRNHEEDEEDALSVASSEATASSSSGSEDEDASDAMAVSRTISSGNVGDGVNVQVLTRLVERFRSERQKWLRRHAKAKSSSKRMAKLSSAILRVAEDAFITEPTPVAPLQATSSANGTLVSRNSSRSDVQSQHTSLSRAGSTSLSTPSHSTVVSTPSGSSGPASGSRQPQPRASASASTSGSTDHQSVRIVQSSYSSKYTSRKPREILPIPSRLDQGRPVAPMNNDFSNMLVTTTLDGCVRVWDVDKRIPVVTVPSNVLDVTWPEAACWLPNNVLAIAPALSFQQKGEITKSRHEMILLYGLPSAYRSPSASNYRARGIKDRVSDTWTYAACWCGDKPGGTVVATAGGAKEVIFWNLDTSNPQDYALRDQSSIQIHKSTIHALAYSPNLSTLFSGSADKTLISTSISNLATTRTSRFSDRIASISVNSAQGGGNVLLVCLAAAEGQCVVWDGRVATGDGVVMRFGVAEHGTTLSSHSTPSFNPSGLFVAYPRRSQPEVCVWDQRFVKTRCTPGATGSDGDSLCDKLKTDHSMNGGAGLREVMWHPTRNMLVTAGIDYRLGFHDIEYINTSGR